MTKKKKNPSALLFLNGVENAEQNQLLFLPHKQKELGVPQIN